LPAAAYLSEAVHAEEQARILASRWLCVGASRIAEAGSFSSGEIGAESLIVVRDRIGG